MSTETSPTRELFVSLEGTEFSDYRDFDDAVQEALADRRGDFPLAYTPHQAISWARENGWIEDSSNGLHVKVR